MLDCWQSMDVNYVVKLASYIEEYQPRWIEEVAMPDRIDSYRKIREKINIPVSGAEHEYTRWGFKRFMDAEALDIIQPDLNWAGGLSETPQNLRIGNRLRPQSPSPTKASHPSAWHGLPPNHRSTPHTSRCS